jgi:PAS domain S-box-containing protein
MCTDQATKMYGGDSVENLIGKNAFDFMAEEDRERATMNLMRTLDEGLIRNVEYNLLTKNGSMYPAELSSSVIRDASGKPIGFVAVTKDISERKRMEQQVLKLLS